MPPAVLTTVSMWFWCWYGRYTAKETNKLRFRKRNRLQNLRKMLQTCFKPTFSSKSCNLFMNRLSIRSSQVQKEVVVTWH